MSPPYYTTAQRLADIPIDAWIGLDLAEAWEDPARVAKAQSLRRDIAALAAGERARDLLEPVLGAAASSPTNAHTAAVTDAWMAGRGDDDALASAWVSELRARLGDTPYRGGSPLVQAPFGASLALAVLSTLALTRQGPLRALPVPLIPPDDAIRIGTGETEITIGADPLDERLPDALLAIVAALGPDVDRVRFAWMQAPASDTPTHVAAALRRHDLVHRLASGTIQQVAETLRVQGVPRIPPQSAWPAESERVLGHAFRLDACGVPRTAGSTFVVGAALFRGSPGAELAESLGLGVTAGRRARPYFETARRLADIPIDTWIGLYRATAGVQASEPSAGGTSRDAWAAELLHQLGTAPYFGGSPIRQMPAQARPALAALASFGPEPVADLPVALVPPDDAIRIGTGAIEVVICADPRDPALPDLLLAAVDGLGAALPRVRFAWMHAPATDSPADAGAALLRHDLVARLAVVGLRAVADRLRAQGVPSGPPPTATWLPEWDRVTAHAMRLDACGFDRTGGSALVAGAKVFRGAADLAHALGIG